MQEVLPLNFDKSRLYKAAFGLAMFTIFYNLAEGVLSTYFGYADDSLTLFGFGVDSFIEVISGLGVAHLVWRIWRKGETERDDFERTALRITGFAFYALTAGLIATAIYNLLTASKPETTFWGVIVSVVSIFVMLALIFAKTKVGRSLDSKAILADANCTKACVYMSVVLLASSVIYELTRFSYVDILGTLGVAYFALKEGRECFAKAKGENCCGCENL